MRHYVPTTYERGHARSAPGRGGLLLVPVVTVAALAVWIALAEAPALVVGFLAGLVLPRVVRWGSRVARRAVAAGRRTVGRLADDRPARAVVRRE